MSGAYITGAKQYPATKSSSARRRARRMKEKLTWRQRLRNWFNKDLEDADIADIALREDSLGGLSGEGLRFQLYQASGGYVVETRHYDEKNDRNHYNLYIVKEDEDVGHAIGKIITMESLR
jgi:hypothetical protein